MRKSDEKIRNKDNARRTVWFFCGYLSAGGRRNRRRPRRSQASLEAGRLAARSLLNALVEGSGVRPVYARPPRTSPPPSAPRGSRSLRGLGSPCALDAPAPPRAAKARRPSRAREAQQPPATGTSASHRWAVLLGMVLCLLGILVLAFTARLVYEYLYPLVSCAGGVLALVALCAARVRRR